MFKGEWASSGIGIGKAVMLNYRERIVRQVQCDNPDREVACLERAIQVFCNQIDQAAGLADKNFGRSQGNILTAQAIIVKDSAFTSEVHHRIKAQSESAEYAVCQVLDDYAQVFAAMQDDLMRAREADLRDIKNRLLAILAGEQQPGARQMPPQSVIVAEQLHVSILAGLPREKIAAIVTARGSVHSHVAILARGVQIPFVTGVGQLIQDICDGDELIVDGGAGEVICRPTPEEISRYRERARQQELVRERLRHHREKQTATRDGRKVEILVELDTLGELSSALESGIDGAFAPGKAQPGSGTIGEHQQFLAAKALARTLGGKPAILTTPEAKLGERSAHSREWGSPIANMDELRVSLRALLSASAFGQVAVILPGISCVAEIALARNLLEDCKADLRGQGTDFDHKLRLGALIETPAAAALALQIAGQADFIVLGADVLACHTLGIDRAAKKTGPKTGDNREVFHPAVLRLICRTIKAARRVGIPAVVRGESAADAMMIPFLIGCGAQGLGVRPHALWGARQQCENLSYRYWRARVPKILSLTSASEVIDYLKQNWAERPENEAGPNHSAN
ncbi:MAG: PEP-utilizing enzyme [Oscillospiraceae bacterium]|nr:PEP-utilizing enzyme [Oscillospiraceae bacterium]